MQVTATNIAPWVSRLVRIPSVNPEQAGPRAGIPGEGALAERLAGWFAEAGAEVITEEVLPGRPNVYGLWRGTGERWLGVDVHTDTVGVEAMTDDPFDGRIEDGRVWGRGAVDTKATLGILLALLHQRQQSGGSRLVNNLLVAATIDEEVGGAGAAAVARRLRAGMLRVDQLLVAEPTDGRPVIGHKGVARLSLTFQGQAAHSAHPEQGRNAIVAAAAVVRAFAAEHERLQRGPVGLLGAPALTVTRLAGGSGVNVVPEQCTLTADRRLVGGEDPQAVLNALTRLATEASPLPLVAEGRISGPAFEQSETAWVRGMSALTGHAPASAPYFTNAAAYPGLPLECIVFGPGSIEQAHRAREWVSLEALEHAAGVYARWLEL